MFGSKTTIHSAGRDMHAMISEAEQILSDASAASGDKASELRQQGMDMLAASIARARDLEQRALESAKAMAHSTDQMVHANPWRSVAGAGLIGAGIGLVIGMAIARE
jgi:ElaB/YqjD/DUF883 family membrane-anchored ribosome-binding protein